MESIENDDPCVNDIEDEDFGIGTNDDQIEDEEINQDIENEIQKDANSQLGIDLIVEPSKSSKYEDDDEQESITSESGSDGGYSSVSTTSPPPPAAGQGRGRGRPSKLAMTKSTESAIPGRGILTVSVLDTDDEPSIKQANNKEYYTQKLPQARVSRNYHRRHETPEVKAERLAALAAKPALIDFTVKFARISIIVDKDDSDEQGFKHAQQRLQELSPTIDLTSKKYSHEIWNSGLYIYSLTFPTELTCNLLELVPQEINNEDKRPYWLSFKQPPEFIDKSFYKLTNQDTTKKGCLFLIDNGINASLSPGALTTMSRFHALKHHGYSKRGRWYMIIYDESIDIRSYERQPTAELGTSPSISMKHKIPLEIIDRVAIFSPWKGGFALYLNIKGNIHVYKKIIKSETGTLFERQGMKNNTPIPAFTTIRLRFQLMDDEIIAETLERTETITSTMSNADKQTSIQARKEELLQQIREIFQNLIKFFDKNRIHICFARIKSHEISLEEILSLNAINFQSFVRNFSWTMLQQMNFRVQVQICRFSSELKKKLEKYENERFPEETSEQIDDRFYRLCLYLHRRASEYIFLNLNDEFDIAKDDYELKFKRAKEKRTQLKNFNEISTSAAYVPSIVITPTTIKIRPLKLCKLNRVLREERFGGCLNFALVELRDEAQRMLFATVFRALKSQILHFLTKGFGITSDRIYRYLHHSQSQVKCKQFWFYHHDQQKRYLSHDDAYTWMGSFDSERVVSKHTARIALCFTSTDQSIRIPAEMVTYARDIKDKTGDYTFSDGVGTISTHLRNEIKKYLKCRHTFSVIQIRYGGCKGTLSVDWRLDINPHYQLVIRDSMNKFTSDHDLLEVCKLSAPRELHLNRQDIVLLESRGIPDTTFLRLQNDEHFWLVRSLLQTSIAYELLQEKLVPVFELRKIALKMNIVNEPFFIQLIITCSFNIIRELIDRTRIRMDKNRARNMFGIVDEYGVLESGQIFIQYTKTRPKQLENFDGEGRGYSEELEVYTGKVVVTKNPCHHPGDLRVFDAVYHPYLKHLKDVIVFPQKGDRPHSNEISGSDLDGDEYVVIWHEDLIPTTPNEKPYNYDGVKRSDDDSDTSDEPDEWDEVMPSIEPEESNESYKLKRPITRDDINTVVMRISEQDCLGPLSNIHLAYVDKKPKGIKARVCKKLAGAISKEVDAAKTGKHPLSEEQLKQFREKLDNKYPDFMKTRGKREYYPSKRVLGKLYRSARRAVTGWTQAINNHGNTHHIQLALSLMSDDKISADEVKPFDSKIILDPDIHHERHLDYLKEIKVLYRSYKQELLEIISLYHFHDEIDLFCRCDSMDASVGGGKRGGLEDSGAVELENLVERIKQQFYHEFEIISKQRRCCKRVEKQTRSDRILYKFGSCEDCLNKKTAKAVCAYIYTYEQANKLPPKSTRRILSFPWLFASYLLHARIRNNFENYQPPNATVVGQACQIYLKNLVPQFRAFTPTNITDQSQIEIFYSSPSIERKSMKITLLQACFIEILNDWLTKQNIFGTECDETKFKPFISETIWHELLVEFLSNENIPNVRLLFKSETQTISNENYTQTLRTYSRTWKQNELILIEQMFENIRLLAVKRADETRQTIWSYLDEYIILALQSIAITKQLNDKWI